MAVSGRSAFDRQVVKADNKASTSNLLSSSPEPPKFRSERAAELKQFGRQSSARC